MKTGTHPDYHLIKVQMTDGTTLPDPLDLGQGRRHAAARHRPHRAPGLDRRPRQHARHRRPGRALQQALRRPHPRQEVSRQPSLRRCRTSTTRTQYARLRRWRPSAWSLRHSQERLRRPARDRRRRRGACGSLAPARSCDEDCWRRLAASVGMWDLLGFGGWAVERKADDKLVGTVGLFNAWRELEPEFGERARNGLDLRREGARAGLCGRGLPGGARTGPTPISSRRRSGRSSRRQCASFRLAERLGFERLRTTALYHDEPIAVLERPAALTPRKPAIPVIARPRIRAWTSCVPS